jgi:hypothetical protein
MQVLFICCAVLVNIRKIRRVFSNMSLFLKKSYKQRYHLCYTHICLRFTTYEYLPPEKNMLILFNLYKTLLLKLEGQATVSLKVVSRKRKRIKWASDPLYNQIFTDLRLNVLFKVKQYL